MPPANQRLFAKQMVQGVVSDAREVRKGIGESTQNGASGRQFIRDDRYRMMKENGSGNMLSPDIKFYLVRKIETHKVVALKGTSLLPHEKKYLEFHKPAGVVLFERNLESISQLDELIESVKARLAAGGMDPFIMVDHEGDIISELQGLIGVPPSPMAIAATANVEMAYSVALATGEMMSKLGINTILGPSADCCFNISSPITGLRSFGRDPSEVAEYVGAAVRGFQEAGMLTCTKHFPGHGSTVHDSHKILPVVTKDMDELKREDLVPFARAIDAGTDMIMAAHVAYKTGDSSEEHTPASFNRALINGLLRKEMSFDGVVITDALEMLGARSHARKRYGGLAGGLERPLLAGADLLLYSRPVPELVSIGEGDESLLSIQVMETVIDTLERVVDKSRIENKLKAAAQEIDGLSTLLSIFEESEIRIMRLREKAAGILPSPKASADDKVIELSNYATVPSIYRTVAEEAVALWQVPEGFVPMDKENSYLVVPVVYHPGGMIRGQRLDAFFQVLAKHFPNSRRTAEIVDFEVDEEGRRRPRYAQEASAQADDVLLGLPDKAGESEDVILVFSARGAPPHAFMQGLRNFMRDCACVIVIITGWPLFNWIPQGVGALITFGSSAQAASAAARVLQGKIRACGRLSHVPEHRA